MSETNNQATKLVPERKKTKFTAQFKLDRALEILHTDNVAEVARKYAISPNLLYQWRDQLINNCAYGVIRIQAELYMV